MWTLSIRPARETGLAAVDVVVNARSHATVGDLAMALGCHLVPGSGGLLLAPVRDGTQWPAAQLLSESGLRSGDLLDVIAVPQSWLRRPGPPVKRRATLRVIAGPDAGQEIGIVGESATIGRSQACTVTLTDPLVSRRHARLMLTGRPLLVDDGSANGTSIGGTQVVRPTPLEFGVPLGLGDSVLVVEAATADFGDRNGVLRPPRFGEPLQEETIEVASPPNPPRPQPFQWTMMLMPLLMGVGMLALWRGRNSLVYMLGYIVIYPFIMLLANFIQKRQAKKEHREALKLWYREVRDVVDRLDLHALAQRKRAVEDHPEPVDLSRRVLTRHRALWTRHTDHDDFLASRVGLGPVPAKLTAKLGGGGDREAIAKAKPELDRRAMLADQPVVIPFGQNRVVAIVGPGASVDDTVRAMVLRLCCDHSPAELSIAGILGPKRQAHEEWLRWLPHAGRRIGGLAPISIGGVDGAALLDQLAVDDGNGVTVCLVDGEAGLSRRQIEGVARVAGDRLRLIWLGDSPDTVPAATDAVVDLTASIAADMAMAAVAAAYIEVEPTAVAAYKNRQGVVPIAGVDIVELSEAWRTARAMTTYTDEVALLPAESALPEVARLPDLVADIDDPDSVEGVLARWSARASLRAPIGMGVDGVVTIDLRQDGPHGLVAGTTGSGKSELLQTLIVSLALSNPPGRISFLLVDYKGGAAFRECADLPHTVGYITDLSPALVTRALISLNAEITAREELLGRYGAKDLSALEQSHPDAAPPSLLICVDEFAALTAEVPDFVTGMVNIAQRGRSLGMHLLLATQRPAGVVTANIRANADLRIALRVASHEDSSDVIDRKEAASISRRTPGRAWIRRIGHGTDELVQIAWVGARAPMAAARPVVEIEAFSAKGIAKVTRPDELVHQHTDLERLVTTIGEAFIRSGHPTPSRPWLPPLPSQLRLGATGGELLFGAEALDAEYAPGATTDVIRVAVPSGQVPIGLVDQPKRRAQPPLVLDYQQVGHVIAYGTSGSGKTEFLRTLVVAATLADPTNPPSFYCLDFGGGGLAGLAEWPTVGSVVGEHDMGRAMRLVRMLRHTVIERNQLLSGAGVADLVDLAQAGQRLPRIHVIVDSLTSFCEALESTSVGRAHLDMLNAVFTDGRRVGVHITATASRRASVGSAVQAAFGERLVLRMASADDYSYFGAPTDVVNQDSPPGRGLIGTNEFQCALAAGSGASGAERLARLAAKVPNSMARPVPVRSMPGRVPSSAVLAPQRDEITIGVDADFLHAVTVRLLEGPLLVAGRARSGRTSMLAGLADLARRAETPPVEIVLCGAKADEVPGDFDRRLDDPAAVVDWLPQVRDLAGKRDWRLLLIDDAHLWERGWDNAGPARDAVAGLAALIEDHVEGQAIVVATDVDDARGRGYIDGVATAAKARRRGVLLQPDLSDGSLFSVMLPNAAVEPMTGIGRGVYCNNGAIQVIQVVGSAARSTP